MEIKYEPEEGKQITIMSFEEMLDLERLIKRLDGREKAGIRLRVKVNIETHFQNGDVISFSLNDVMKAFHDEMNAQNEKSVWDFLKSARGANQKEKRND